MPLNEGKRLAALRQYGILDTAAEQAYDDFTTLAATICDMPIALISLVDDERQWFKAKLGIDLDQTPRSVSFCAHAILQPDKVLEVRNALEDARFADNPSVRGDPEIRFYAGAPLVTPGGLAIGTICVADHKPRRLTERERNALCVLSRQVVAQLELRRSALTDELTQLPNRAVIMTRLEQAIARARCSADYRYALLFMDLDRFKLINDSLGHGVGDELLQQAAQRLRHALRADDFVVRTDSGVHCASRIGGDEFVVLLENLRREEDAKSIAQRLLFALSQPYRIAQHEVHSGATMGIVTSEHAADQASDVIRDADTAMYEAKRARRGSCMVFHPAMRERVMQRLDLENELRIALRDGHLTVAYQPIVELASGRVESVEALARWHHPVRGPIPPADFIPVAEESGLIGPLGEWVLNAACLQMMRWQRALGDKAPGSVAVNLSRAQLSKPTLVSTVRETLECFHLDPSQLHLEVTESLAAQDDSVKDTLRALKALGVGLALDDFGTGYSSLACLHELPVDCVKIDRSFVLLAEHSHHHRVLVQATVMVAQALDMTIVAEGVETREQATLLQQLECRQAQGYLFSKPLAGDALETLLRSGQLSA